MKRETIKLKDGTELKYECDLLYSDDLNQLLYEGKQFFKVGDYNIRIDAIEWVKLEEIKEENCENEIQ